VVAKWFHDVASKCKLPLCTKIKKMQMSLQERQQQEEELKVKEAELLRGNPLLNNPTSFNVKRRFDTRYFSNCLLKQKMTLFTVNPVGLP